MRAWWAAVRYLRASARVPSEGAAPEALRLPDRGGEPLDCDLYVPSGVPKGTVLIAHGMNRLGRRDPRLVHQARAWVEAGFEVAIPELPDVTALLVTAATIRHLEEAIAGVARQRRAEGPLLLFAVSFTGAFALRAVLGEGLQEEVGALCLLGAYSDSDRVLRAVLVDEGVDPYPRWIVVWNLLLRLREASAEVLAVVEQAIDDHAFQAAAPHFEECFAALGPEDRSLVESLRDDPAVRLAMLERGLGSDPDLANTLRLDHLTQGLELPVILIHGQQDDVISPSESERLAARLEQAGVPHRLLVTPLLDHADARLSLDMVGQVVALAHTLAWFIAQGARRRATKATG